MTIDETTASQPPAHLAVRNAGIPRGTLIPHLSLAPADTGAPVPLRGGRGPKVYFLAHSSGCQECERYVAALADSAEKLAEWGGSALVIAPDSGDGYRRADGVGSGGVRLLTDREGKVAARLGLTAPALLVTDEWGEIYFAAAADDGHAMPDTDEVVDWVRFASIQCPECEGPEGEWK